MERLNYLLIEEEKLYWRYSIKKTTIMERDYELILLYDTYMNWIRRNIMTELQYLYPGRFENRDLSNLEADEVEVDYLHGNTKLLNKSTFKLDVEDEQVLLRQDNELKSILIEKKMKFNDYLLDMDFMEGEGMVSHFTFWIYEEGDNIETPSFHIDLSFKAFIAAERQSNINKLLL